MKIVEDEDSGMVVKRFLMIVRIDVICFCFTCRNGTLNNIFKLQQKQ